MLLALALGLTACADSTPFADPKLSIKPVLQAAPQALSAPCEGPVAVPPGAKSQREVEGLWGRDRASLVDCRERKAAVQDYYTRRDGELTR